MEDTKNGKASHWQNNNAKLFQKVVTTNGSGGETANNNVTKLMKDYQDNNEAIIQTL